MKHLGRLLLMALAISCSNNDKTEEKPEPQADITSFTFEQFNPVVVGEIDQENLSISVVIPSDANIKSLTPTIKATPEATITPAPGYIYDFSNGLDFKVTNGTVSKTYSVSVSKALNSAKDVLGFEVPDYYVNGTITGDQIALSFRYGTDLTQITPKLTLSPDATATPANGATVDLSQGLTYTVTAQDGSTKSYTVTATVQPQETAVRAFWIPATWHSPILRSYQGIQDGVALANELNFNVLYVCAWSQTRSLYPSQTLANNSSYATPEEALFNNYTGGSGDPLKDLIEEAHKYNIKVILWYEYGFMSKFGVVPTPQNDRILAEHPDWIGINNQGGASAYNNSDYYYNAYNPEVQEFMLDMIMEAVNNYDIDGIQGDDRLPAMPRNSGYDDYTKAKYFEAKGSYPPSDINQWDWVRFRADILNNFAREMYSRVKTAKPNLIVGFSPNPYPWAFDNLMQEWPVWLQDNLIDILSVQCYRSTVNQYSTTVDEVLFYYNRNGSGDKTKLSPGVLLKGSNGLTDPAILAGQIMKNREKGIPGESFFYDVPLQVEEIQKVIKAFYPGKALLPEF